MVGYELSQSPFYFRDESCNREPKAQHGKAQSSESSALSTLPLFFYGSLSIIPTVSHGVLSIPQYAFSDSSELSLSIFLRFIFYVLKRVILGSDV